MVESGTQWERNDLVKQEIRWRLPGFNKEEEMRQMVFSALQGNRHGCIQAATEMVDVPYSWRGSKTNSPHLMF